MRENEKTERREKRSLIPRSLWRVKGNKYLRHSVNYALKGLKYKRMFGK